MRLSRTFAAVIFLASLPALAQGVWKIELDEAIHPITEEYVVGGIEKANGGGAGLILVDIDTPGGYIKNVEAIQRAVLSSKAPVAAFVTPSGARAASGGALVAVACDFIAMAPGTTIGSAHPVSGLPIPVGEKGEKEKKSDEVMMEKLINDLNAHLRSMAQIRGRNEEPIQRMVRESISLTEKEALEQKVIELVCSSEDELLTALEGRTLKRFDGSETLLPVSLGPVSRVEMTIRQKVLSAIASPEVAFLLLLIGLLGLFVEFKSPGLIFPGIIGGIAVLLYLLSLPLLPVNAVGILLIILGVVFFILEIKVVSYGMLGTGGTVALVIGALMLYKGNPLTGEGLKLSFVLPIVLGFAAIMAFLVYIAVKAFKNPVQSGVETMIGQKAEVRAKIEPPRQGKVFISGEYWNAVAKVTIEEGATVRITAIDGMVLTVEPAE